MCWIFVSQVFSLFFFFSSLTFYATFLFFSSSFFLSCLVVPLGKPVINSKNVVASQQNKPYDPFYKNSFSLLLCFSSVKMLPWRCGWSATWQGRAIVTLFFLRISMGLVISFILQSIQTLIPFNLGMHTKEFQHSWITKIIQDSTLPSVKYSFANSRFSNPL
jgi:hypothetical protein